MILQRCSYTLVDDFNQNSTYRLDSENKIMEVSYQGQTKQVTTLDDGYWMYMMTHSGGFSPEISLADMWCDRLTIRFHIHNGRGADLGLLAACTLGYGSDCRPVWSMVYSWPQVPGRMSWEMGTKV